MNETFMSWLMRLNYLHECGIKEWVKMNHKKHHVTITTEVNNSGKYFIKKDLIAWSRVFCKIQTTKKLPYDDTILDVIA